MWCFFKSMSQTSCSISINLELSPISSHLESLGKVLKSIPRLSFLSHLLIYWFIDLSIYLFIYFVEVCVHMSCVHACVCLCVCSTYMGRCVCLWLLIWRSEIRVGHLTLIVSTLLFEAESLIEPRAQCWCIMASQVAHDPLVSTLYAGITRGWSCSWPFAWVVGMRTKVLMFTLQELYSPKHLSILQPRMREMEESKHW